MKNRIPSIPKKKLETLIKYAEDPKNWLDIDVENDLDEYMIRYNGIEIIHTIDYKNNEDAKDGGGKLPLRHLSFKALQEVNQQAMKDFMERTVKHFGFANPKIIGKRGRIHYYEAMFDVP